MKKIALACAVLMLFTLCGCQRSPNIDGDLKTIVYDKDNNIIADVENGSNFVLLDDGFVYTENNTNNDDHTPIMQCHRYFFADGRDVTLGMLSPWAYISPCSAYINNHLCLLVTSEVKSDKQSGTLTLWDIDLRENTMNRVSEEDGMYYYSSMGIDARDTNNESLLILKQRVDGDMELKRYAPGSIETTVPQDYVFDNAKSNGDNVKGMFINGLTTTFLRLDTDKSLWFDNYDSKMSFLNNINVDVLSNTKSEREQIVRDLYAFDGNYIYYRNIGKTTFFGQITGGVLKSAMDTSGSFLKAQDASSQKDKAVFFDKKQKDIYYFNNTAGKDKKMTKAKFTLCKQGFSIENVYKSQMDNLLVSTVKTDIFGNVKERQLYYIKITDLDFSENVKLLTDET